MDKDRKGALYRKKSKKRGRIQRKNGIKGQGAKKRIKKRGILEKGGNEGRYTEKKDPKG